MNPENLSHRVFLALPLAQHFLRDFESILSDCSASFKEIKWVKPSQVHITLHFFGNVTTEQINLIEKTVRSVTAGLKPLNLGLHGIGCFPNPAHPRIIWLGLKGDVDALTQMQNHIERELSKSGFPVEERSFKGHATLGRVKDGKETAVKNFLSHPALQRIREKSTELKSFDHLILFESHLSPQGPVYEERLKFYLSEQP